MIWAKIWSRRRWALSMLGVGVGIGLLVIFGLGLAASFAPIELPELDVPSRLYSQPYWIRGGTSVDASGIVRRLQRLGYHEVTQGELKPGEFRKSKRKVSFNRRPFRGPLADGGEGVFTLRLDSARRIRSIRGSHGEPQARVALEPEIIGELHGRQREDRYIVPLNEMPAHLVDAVLVVEDRRFYEHGGIDLRRLAGAFLANLRAGRIVQGGSTLSQQLVKNVFLTDERTLVRKLREAWLALRVEKSHQKAEILEAYLNTIYLGQRGSVSVRGMEAAARHYFGKHVQKITLAESALLAGLIRGPGLYSPFLLPETARERRNLVLAMLFEEDRIAEEAYEEARQSPLGDLPYAAQAVSAPYFTEYVKRELAREFPELDPEEARLAVYTGLDADAQNAAQEALRRGLLRLERDFPNLVREDNPLQAAFVSLHPESGQILALVGGRDFARSQFDRATQAKRQPGSVFKPIVALTALARDASGTPEFTLASFIEDEPLSVETREGLWEPRNHDDEFRGFVSLRDALEQSINVPFARLGMQVGSERIIETARELGIESRLRAVPSLALGSFEVSPLEIARAYSVLAAGGQRLPTRSYLRVRDIDGRDVAIPEASRKRVFPPDEVALVTSALQGVVDRGTGRGVRTWGFRGPVAGKTGTTNEARDAWFVGYTQNVVAAVWVGFDDGTPMGLSGAVAALPIFSEFLVHTQGARGGQEFPLPVGLERVQINRDSGLRAGLTCPGEPEFFLAGTAPLEACGPGGWFRSERRRNEDWDRSRPRPERRRGIFGILDAVLDTIAGEY